MQEHAAFTQKLDDLWVRSEYVLAAKVLDVKEKVSGIVDRTIDLKPILFADMKVVRSVTGSRMNAAGT
jgi:hypothetical protein